jgi:hypothetical protein
MTPIRLFAGTAEGLARFAEANRLDPEQESTRTRYLGALPEDASIAWPPGRNAPCWCASGRKYKKCCGAVRRPAGSEHRTARCADRSARRTRRPGPGVLTVRRGAHLRDRCRTGRTGTEPG